MLTLATLSLAGVPARPNVTAINQYGAFNFSYPRLAFIDGSEDRMFACLLATTKSFGSHGSQTRSLDLRDPSLASRAA